ncbi:MAG: ubiquinol-cytochrome c reductase iron-sulfur subunit [Rhodospirillales bacterium]|nr:ubiquinol-cytochrome c reductase iron-sulfur subunit [Alphaproteobacteria bacterium]MCB9987642.1 ubiquinol-cytochrome c reductase iron-sulfur subunit [Rhodospirillales bacterium]USO08059.1 MAG: ubiquinol-cytochrome c reductase iron-sulfur subunit [Rhodospirillales bacterium]
MSNPPFPSSGDPVYGAPISSTSHGEKPANAGRRDFLYLTTGAVAAVGAGLTGWTFVDSMNPAADTLALSTTEANVAAIEPGQGVVVTWQGKPVFIRRRTPKEIEEAKDVDVSTLRDPQSDAERVLPGHENLLVVVGICTHLGCVPLGTKQGEPRGDYGGWFCPCHGSHYDTAGRIRKGPAPKNLNLPPYAFSSDSVIKIG